MNEEGSRLEHLRYARRLLAWQTEQQMRQLDHWIAVEERREEARRAAAARRAARAAPGWTLGLTQAGQPEEVHQGWCFVIQRRQNRITVDEARELLAQGITACHVCRPDSELGF
ncbi:DUF6233 domain-containing protein [Streptomyces bacillaris]|uniref:DUF6233 domain-containing protein n=1 Tax=Streptomyces bacillaris TaxID=68179 RepID=UPI0036423017